MAEATAKERYTELEPSREPFLKRARDFARLTIPSLLPRNGHTQVSDLEETYTGFGARLVTSLASRLTTAFLPAGQPWFAMSVAPEALMVSGQDSVPEEVSQNLAKAEKIMLRETERKKWRQPTYTALQHLIVTGNVGEEILPDNRIKLYKLDQFVVVRSPDGALVEFVIMERIHKNALDDDLADLLKDKKPDAKDNTFPIYTWGKWNSDDGVWEVHQEVDDKVIEGSDASYEVSPYNFLRWTEISGEDYGRSKVEDHWGDLRSLEGFSKSTLEGAAMASRNITMIRPNAAGGLNLRRRLAKARNGDYVVGNPDDVDMKQFTNVSGVQLAQEAKVEVKQELASAFLMNSAAQRDAERVTAFELRKMIEEIESVLGGVFTSLAPEIQEHRIKRLTTQMQENQQLPAWPEEVIDPSILTGLEALSRERELEKIATVLQFIQQLPPEVIQTYPKWTELLTKVFTAAGLPDMVKTEREAEALRQQVLAEQSVAKAGEQIATQAAKQGE